MLKKRAIITDAQRAARNEVYLDSMAACGGCIYLHDYNNACVWGVGPEANEVAALPEIISQEGAAHTRISALAARADGLYALASSYRTDASGMSHLGSGLYALSPSDSALEAEQICALDLSAYVTSIEGWGEELPPCAMVLQDGALFCLFPSHSALLQISLADASVRPIDVEDAVYLGKYAGEQLLVACQNPDGSQRLAAYDPAKGAVEHLLDGVYPSVSGFVYREADRMLYAVSEGAVYRIDPHAERAKAEACGALSHYDSMVGGADAGERLIWYSPSEAVAARMDAEAQEARTLRYSVIRKRFARDDRRFCARAGRIAHAERLPDEPRDHRRHADPQRRGGRVHLKHYGGGRVPLALQAGLFAAAEQRENHRKARRNVPAFAGVGDAGRRGARTAHLLDPARQPAGRQSGAVRPAGARGSGELAGASRPSGSGVDAHLLSRQDAQALERELFSLLMSSYSAAMNSGAGSSCYDTPELLQRLRALDCERLLRSAAPDRQDDADVLLALDTPDGCRVRRGDFEPLPLAVSAGQSAYVCASVMLLCINPYSQNQALALEFLEYSLEHLSPLAGAQLFATAEAPIEDENYAALRQEYEQELARRQAMVEAANGAERTALQKELAHYIESSEATLADARYIVTQESLSAFRARLNACVPYFNETLSKDDTTRLSDAHARYFAGTLSAEAYLQELDRQITMRALEDES